VRILRGRGAHEPLSVVAPQEGSRRTRPPAEGPPAKWV
jgi:hypothetical protein